MILHKLWFYYRHGSAYYVTQIIQAINTVILIYFVAGDKIFFIRDVFPNIIVFLIVAIGVGFPLVVLIGKLHYQRAYKSEADVLTRENPFNTKILMPVLLEMIRDMRSRNQFDPRLKEIESYIQHITNGGRLDESWRPNSSKARGEESTSNIKASKISNLRTDSNFSGQ